MRLLSGQTPEALARRFPDAATVSEWISAQLGRAEADVPLAVDWIWQSYAYDAHDLGTTPGFSGETARALGYIAAACLILSPPLDLYNPTAAAREVASLVPAAAFEEIPSVRGHQSASAGDETEAGWLNGRIGAFLERDVL
jgi:homoserine O-acetyltransferase